MLSELGIQLFPPVLIYKRKLLYSLIISWASGNKYSFTLILIALIKMELKHRWKEEIISNEFVEVILWHVSSLPEESEPQIHKLVSLKPE